VLPGVDIGRHCVLKKCIIDRDCKLPEGMQIGVDAARDRQRFHVTASGLMLVTRSMLGQDMDVIR